MPGPGDPNDPDHDDLIGFSSPASLQGQSRAAADATDTAPVARDGPVLRPALSERSSPMRETVRAAATEDAFAPRSGSNRAAQRARPAETDSFTLAIYVLILMTVPTLGVAGVIALVAVRGRAVPADETLRSHFVYQKRTLQWGGLAAIAGVILLAAPFALGVTILFGLALWLLVRGAAGVWKLKSMRGIDDPVGWWI